VSPEEALEPVDEAKLFSGDDAGDAFEELEVETPLEVEFDAEEALSVVVGRKTPL
jgi:hypothetical protein